MTASGIRSRRRLQGLTLIELIVSVAMGGLILAALSSLLGQVLQADDYVRVQNDRLQDARFAMQRMAAAVLGTHQLILPTPDNPNTTTHPLNGAVTWDESIREQTIPATVGREFESAVLAVALGSAADYDQDGFSDADNDRDGRIDEDPSGDLSNDLATGIIGIDDDGDGSIDEPHGSSGPDEDDDDEDGTANDDGWNGLDDDGDGNVDEDPKKDMSGEGKAGIPDFDDDGDGTIDEGDKNDDDEDGFVNEDWPDSLVFFLQGDLLIERRPNVHATNGLDYVENTIAENVAGFRVERISQGNGRAVTVAIRLEQLSAVGDNVVLDTLLRVGGAL